MLPTIEPETFIITPEIERAFGITPDVLHYFFFWEPCGDECEVYRHHKDGIKEGGTSSWQTFQVLKRANPIMYKYNFGSSDGEAEYCVFVCKVENKVIFVDKKEIEKSFWKRKV